MEIRCVNCGAILNAAPPIGMPYVCHYCGTTQPSQAGAPQGPYGAPQSPYGAPPSPYGAPPSPYGAGPTPYGAPPGGFGVPPGGFGSVPTAGVSVRPNVAPIIIVVALVMVMGGVGAAVALRQAVGSSPGLPSVAGGLNVATLATMSLAQPPESIQKMTGVVPKPEPAFNEIDMDVSLSGSPYNRAEFEWDSKDPSHVKAVHLYAEAPPPNDAAIRQKLAAAIPRRLDEKESFYFNGVNFSYDLDHVFMQASPSSGSDSNPNWKPQADAAWDLMRQAVLGLPVTVTDADKRDWLGGGYPLTTIGAMDIGVDVDHAMAAMKTTFPGASLRQSSGIDATVAIDHPWFGEVDMSWENAKAAPLNRMLFRPPPQAKDGFTNQAEIEACVQGIIGGKAERREGDHLKGTYSTEWNDPDGGRVNVDHSSLDVSLADVFVKKKMTHPGFQKLMNGLAACAPKK